jgi:hypothetical protein
MARSDLEWSHQLPSMCFPLGNGFFFFKLYLKEEIRQTDGHLFNWFAIYTLKHIEKYWICFRKQIIDLAKTKSLEEISQEVLGPVFFELHLISKTSSALY